MIKGYQMDRYKVYFYNIVPREDLMLYKENHYEIKSAKEQSWLSLLETGDFKKLPPADELLSLLSLFSAQFDHHEKLNDLRKQENYKELMQEVRAAQQYTKAIITLGYRK